jgi:phage host-nuclease inhibitor protein Gam
VNKQVKVKTRGANLPVPQNKDEASAAIAEIGRLDRRLQRLDADCKDALAKVKEEFEAKAAPIADERTALTEGLKIYCEGHRDELTNGGKTKTVSFPAGSASWRLRPPSVTLRNAEALIALLKERGLKQLIRVKEEINKEAILAEPATVEGIKGISIGSAGEDFTVEPFAPEGLEAAS